MLPCTLRVWCPHTLLNNRPSVTVTCSILPQQHKFLHVLTLFHTVSEIRARSLFSGRQTDCMFSAYSKYHWKFQNHSKFALLGHSRLLCHCANGTAGDRVFAGPGQRRGSSSHWNKGLWKNLIISHCISWMNFYLLLLMPHTTICTFKITNEAPFKKDLRICM